MGRIFLGFRFFGNRNTTTGEPHRSTGRCNIAGELVGFSSPALLDRWLYVEKLYAPCGCDGGERIAVTKKEARKLFYGVVFGEFEAIVEMLDIDL